MFFKQLIDLGDEASNEAQLSADDHLSMSKEQLIEHIRRHDTRHAELKAEYDKLQSDSLSLRSEYDAYKRKVDGWQRQMKEARAADRKMIEELREAGSTGKIDDVYIKSTAETIQQLKESLREAQDEVGKAYKKQREAEEQRIAAEQSKKTELEELGAKFDTFKERTKAAQDKLEIQLEELRSESKRGSSSTAAAQLKAQLETSEKQRQNLQRRIEMLEASTASGMEEASPGDGSTRAAATLASSNAEIALLQDELSRLNLQLSAAASKEQELQERIQKAEDKLVRQIEDAQWDALDAEKKLAESKTQMDMLRTRIAQLETKLDSKEEERQVNEKQSRRAVRDLEDALTLEKERRAADIRELQEQRLRLEQELQVEREKAAHNSELVGEAESATRKTAEVLEAQRRHFEKILLEKDQYIQQLHGIKESLEVAVQEAKEDIRHRADVLEDLRRELDQSSERVIELENLQLINQRLLNSREEDVLAREKERQKLRNQLRQEEDSISKMRSLINAHETRLSELESDLRKKDVVVQEFESSRSILQSELSVARTSLQEQSKLLKQQESHIHELNGRIQDQGIRNSDIQRYRDDQSAKIRSLEQRNVELEAELIRSHKDPAQVAPSGSHPKSHGSAVVDVLEYAASRVSPAMIKKQFVTDAIAAVRTQKFFTMSLANYRQVIVVAVCLFLFLSMFGGFHTQQANSSDSESLLTLREKYGQSLVSASMCRESLAQLKEQLTGMCPCKK